MNITEKLTNKKYYVRSVKEYKTIIKKLNKEYPKFLKAIPKMTNKTALKHPLMKSLEELKCIMSGPKNL
jgi:hypothetical protein